MPHIGEKQELLAARVAAAAAIGLLVIFGSIPGFCGAGGGVCLWSGGCIFLPGEIIMGIFYKRMNKKAPLPVC